MSNLGTPQVFISHSSQDREFVEQEVIRVLNAHGIQTWYSKDDVQTATPFGKTIVEALSRCDWFLVVMSPRSIESEWVKSEVDWAVRNRWGNVIPVLMEECDPDLLHLFMSRLQFVDFRIDLRQARQRLLIPFEIPLSPEFATSSFAGKLDETAGPVEPPAVSRLVTPTTPPEKHPAPLLRPIFHCGAVVPPEYFIGREGELQEAQRLIQNGHSFLLVGRHRDGKTSLSKMLIHQMLGDPQNRVLPIYLNVQMWPDLSIEAFLEHTIIGMIGDMSRDVFKLNFKFLSIASDDLDEAPPRLREDEDFRSFLKIYQHVRKRTYSRQGESPDAFRTDEFLEIHHVLMELLRSKGWSGCAVFYDEANRLSQEIRVEQLVSHEEALAVPGRTSVYAASPTMADTFLQLKKSFVREVALKPFGLDEIWRLLACYYFSEESRTGEVPVTEDAARKLLEFSQGRPYLIQMLAQESFELANQMGDAEVTGDHIIKANETLKE